MGLFNPNFSFEKITDIPLKFFLDNGINTVLLDVDNTLTTHHGKDLVQGVKEWIETVAAAGIKLIVLSNSKDFRIRPFAEKIGLPFISLALKPLPFGYIRGMKKGDAKRRETVIIGDQIFTDVLGASLCGVRSALLSPIEPESGWSFKLRRNIERKILPERRV